MIEIKLIDNEKELFTTLDEYNIEDMLHTFEEMVRMYSDLDCDVDNFILKRAKEIQIRQLN